MITISATSKAMGRFFETTARSKALAIAVKRQGYSYNFQTVDVVTSIRQQWVEVETDHGEWTLVAETFQRPAATDSYTAAQSGNEINPGNFGSYQPL